MTDIAHVLLDLDQTVVSSLPLTESAYLANSGSSPRPTEAQLAQLDGTGLAAHKIMQDTYVVYERPHLQDFLDELFGLFHVSVFTAASKPYASEIVRTCILPLDRPQRRLRYLFWNAHGLISAARYSGNHKRIKMLADDFGLPGFESAVLIDDTRQWAQGQEDNVIVVHPFSVATAIGKGDPAGIAALANDKVLVDLITK